MKIRALRFPADPPRAGPLPGELTCARSQDLEQAKPANGPLAYLVRREDLAPLRLFTDLIMDQGLRQGKGKELARYLLGLAADKIPLIDGNYQPPGSQVVRSLRDLVQTARRKEEGKLFIIGVETAIFERLWAQAEAGGKPAAATQEPAAAGKPRRTPAASVAEAMRGDPQVHLLRELEGRYPEQDLEQHYVGHSVAAQLVRQLILYAGHVKEPVLIIGATGTGKEVVARQIHEVYRGPKDSLKFVAVNCGAIPEELLESELFGHVKGAFTGAIAHKTGLWQEVGKGTLFLDEIGDLSHRHQVKILRALQEGKIRKVGGTQDIEVEARVVAASNRDLYTLVQRDDFREDLYYRLRGLLIRTPALRDNAEDIPLLAQCFWKKIIDDDQPSLPTEILDALQSYTWPGNARELKTVLSTLHALFGRRALKADHLAWVFYTTWKVNC